MVDAYPLQWPRGWKRTSESVRRKASFKTTFGVARDKLLGEVELLKGVGAIISSNIPLNKFGLPFATYAEPADPGVVIYFELFGKQQCVPCDKWIKVVDNMQAIRLCIKALRGLERWGAKDMVQASFTGFIALPDNTGIPLFFTDCTSKEQVRERYLRLAKELHPDTGGESREFAEMQRQYSEEMKKYG